jgi:hypothetical protein
VEQSGNGFGSRCYVPKALGSEPIADRQRERGKECVVSDTVTTAALAERITPEMIEAGAQIVWRNFDDLIPFGSETGRWTAVEVFRAMEAARHRTARTEP